LNVFDEDKNKLIEFVMKESLDKVTALHCASQTGNEQIVALLLAVFGKENKS